MVLTRDARVWLLSILLAAGSAALWVGGGEGIGAGPGRSHQMVTWLGLVAAFAVTEAFVVHLNVGKHAHTFAIADTVVVMGLFVADPSVLLTARLLGAAITLSAVRRQRPIKLVFNLAQLALGIVIAITLWSWGGAHSVNSQGAWPLAMLATLFVAVVSSTAVTAVIWIHGTRPSAHGFLRAIGTDLVTTGAQTAFALVAISVATVDWRGLWAVAVVAAYVAHAQRSHIRLQQRHGALQRLNEVAARLNQDLHADVIAQEIVAGAVRTFNASAAELVLSGETQRFRHDTAPSPSPSPTEADSSIDEMSVELSAHGRVLGRLRVSGSSEVATFGEDEQDLLHALAQHASTALTNGRLADQLRVQLAENEHQATHDPLTGLPNRVLFDRVVGTIASRGRDAAVLLFDLDRFKEVNDTLGHAAGDALLADIGARLQAAMPGALCIARLGGDEFAVLLTDVDEATAVRTAHAARRSLLHPLEVRSVEVSVDASVGIALAPRHGTASDDLLRHADIAMYDAKNSRGAVSVYDASIDHHDTSRLSLVGELRDAIANGTLQLFYQPKVGLLPGHATSVEALSRWQHPERGFIPPDEFIAVAEQTGLIVPLTDWVLTTALTQCRAWLDAGLDMSVSVNVSARVLRDTTFAQRVTAALAAARVPAARLTIEITETAIMDDVVHTMDVLWELRRAGLRLSVDDLGVGHSSLAYLKRLPIDEVKIDKSFVLTMVDDAADDAIVCAVVGLAHRLGMTVVAEGVETERIRDRLLEIGCDVAQGYWYSRPIPGDDIAEWMQSMSASMQRRVHLAVASEAV